MSQLGSVTPITTRAGAPHAQGGYLSCALTVTTAEGTVQTIPNVLVQEQRPQAALLEQVKLLQKDMALVLQSGPIDMEHTFPPGLPHRWDRTHGQGETPFRLHSAVHRVAAAVTKTGEVALLVKDGGVLSIGPGKAATLYAMVGDTEYPCQYVPQDGGTRVGATADLLLTPAVTGCKVFMLKAGEEMFAFHVNHGDASGDFKAWWRFQGVAHNMLEQYGDIDRLGMDASIDSIFEKMSTRYPQLGELDGVTTTRDKLAVILALPENLKACCGIFTDYLTTETTLTHQGRPGGATPFAGEIVSAFVRTGTTWSLGQFPMLRNRVPTQPTDPRTLRMPASAPFTPLNPPDFREALMEIAGRYAHDGPLPHEAIRI